MENIPPYVFSILSNIGSLIIVLLGVRKYLKDNTKAMLEEYGKVIRRDYEIERLKEQVTESKATVENITQKMHDFELAIFAAARQQETVLNEILDIKEQLKSKGLK